VISYFAQPTHQQATFIHHNVVACNTTIDHILVLWCTATTLGQLGSTHPTPFVAPCTGFWAATYIDAFALPLVVS